MARYHEETKTVIHTFYVAFTGLSAGNIPCFYAMEGSNWKLGGKELNACLPDGWAIVSGPHELMTRLPEDFDPLKAAIAAVDAEIQAARAAFEIQLQDLTRKRNDLLGIGFDTGSVRELTAEEAGQAGVPHADIPF